MSPSKSPTKSQIKMFKKQQSERFTPKEIADAETKHYLQKVRTKMMRVNREVEATFKPDPP
jgi:hypothetical protein